jgi:biopolymer transport protein ExbD
MAMAAGAQEEGEPMIDMNMTPLIDVLLVLLIMFIITIPIQTHAVKLDQKNPNPPPILPTKNKVVITPESTILWNGTPITLVTLRQYLDLTQTMNPVPELHLQPDPQARYELVDKVLAVTKRAQVEKMGFIGNEAYSSW